jgi:acetylglutamate kinase
VAGCEIARAKKVGSSSSLTDEQAFWTVDVSSLISSLKYSRIQKLISDGVVTGGMIPKIECCMRALEGGVTKAHIIDGRIPYSILLELFTDSGIGTQIVKE